MLFSSPKCQILARLLASPTSESHALLVAPLRYMAPEVFLRSYSEKCDVWSVGLVIYDIVCGKPYFGDLPASCKKRHWAGPFFGMAFICVLVMFEGLLGFGMIW